MRAVHRHTLGNEHEHEFEPQTGLPELLPAGEHLLWQGSPDWKSLAVRAFHVRKLLVYFLLMLGLRAGFVIADGGSVGAALVAVAWLTPLVMLAIGGMALMAWLTAKGAVYTITDRRVVMRIGIVLTVTFNLPHKRIEGAAVHLGADGNGDIAITLLKGEKIAWLHLWPHARPWRVGRPEPLLRCIPDAQAVAAVLTQAWSQATGHSVNVASATPPRAEPRPGISGEPALAGD